jgi:DNA invertase Pin-like site-specific DNA recombinase
VDLVGGSQRFWEWLSRGADVVAAVLTSVPLQAGIAAAVLSGLTAFLAMLVLVVARRRRRRPPGSEDPSSAPAGGKRPDGWPVRAAERDATGGTTDGPDRRRSRLAPGAPVIGYVSVSEDASTDKPERSWTAIEAKCDRSGWNLLEIVHDRENRRIRERPGLRYALERIVDRDADGLVVSDLHRLSHSIVDLGALLAWFRDAHATLVALDVGIDTSTPEGHHVAATLIALGNYEHERIVTRTRIGLAEVRAKRSTRGRPAVSDRPELMERIAAMRADNMTLQAIADQLNAEGVPTLRGGAKWRPSSIQATLGYRRPGPRDRLPSLKRDRS